jgi:phosphoglycolate phosphatase
MSAKLFLFDLDGTLLNVKYHRMLHIVDESLKSVGLVNEVHREKKFSGRTDHDIFQSYLTNDNKHLYEDLKQNYIRLMFNELKDGDVDLLDGAAQISEWLVSQNIHWGLLTGNYEITGIKKVEIAGFPLQVSFGVFGDGFLDRATMASVAVEKATLHFNKEIKPESIVIIGDTPNDIRCAKENNYISVAVATGGYTIDQLRQFNPDFLISHLNELPSLFS